MPKKLSALISILLVAVLCACDAPDAGNTNIKTPDVPDGQPAVTVTFFNVGKADAALIQTEEYACLVDTGTKASAEKLISFLEAQGVTHLDSVFLTHTHSDHTGGLKTIAEKYEIPVVYGAVFSERKKNGGNVIESLAEKTGAELKLLSAEDVVEVGSGLFLEVLGPLKLNDDDDNDNSLVMRLDVCGIGFLFTGDMQFAEEETLIQAGSNIDADVLKVGNHGNPDATSPDFARRVSPAHAVISTDTAEDSDSAAPRVCNSLAPAKIYLTQDYETGISFSVFNDGTLALEMPD